MPPKNVDLGDIDGIPVAGTTIAIRNAGDGLSKAMKVDPQLIHHRETVFVVIECECVDVQFPEIKDANEVMRKHILKAGVATLVDRRAVIAALDAQRERIKAAKDAETGAMALDLTTDPLDPDNAEPYEPVGGRKATKAVKKPAKKATKKSASRRTRKPPNAKKAAHLSAVPDKP